MDRRRFRTIQIFNLFAVHILVIVASFHVNAKPDRGPLLWCCQTWIGAIFIVVPAILSTFLILLWRDRVIQLFTILSLVGLLTASIGWAATYFDSTFLGVFWYGADGRSAICATLVMCQGGFEGDISWDHNYPVAREHIGSPLSRFRVQSMAVTGAWLSSSGRFGYCREVVCCAAPPGCIRWGINWKYSSIPTCRSDVQVVLPFWLLTAFCGLLPALALYRMIRQERHPGFCPNCSYDLRAHHSGQRCPECGMVIDAQTSV